MSRMYYTSHILTLLKYQTFKKYFKKLKSVPSKCHRALLVLIDLQDFYIADRSYVVSQIISDIKHYVYLLSCRCGTTSFLRPRPGLYLAPW